MSAIQQMMVAYPDPPKVYATWNPADKYTTVTLSGGDLTASFTNVANGTVRSTISKSSGKWYFELQLTSVSGMNAHGFGIINQFVGLNLVPGQGGSGGLGYQSDTGDIQLNGSAVDFGTAVSVGQWIGIALDADAGTADFYKGSTFQGTATGLSAGIGVPYFPACGCSTNAATGNSCTANFGASAFNMSVPSGYNAGLYN